MTFADWLAAAQPHFPNLSAENCRPTSPADESYNCIAWAAEDSERWWWPDAQQQMYWPPEAPREPSIEAFRAAFALRGYSEAAGAEWELGVRKIAIFANDGRIPTHAARQLRDGWWTSKLAEEIDIEHQLTAIEGPTYGRVQLILARRATTTQASLNRGID